MDMDFATSCPLVRPMLPHIRFLFVGSRLCSTLPSDGPSRFRPCALLVLHLHQVAQGTFTPKTVGHVRHTGRFCAGSAGSAGYSRQAGPVRPVYNTDQPTTAFEGYRDSNRWYPVKADGREEGLMVRAPFAPTANPTSVQRISWAA